MHSLILGFCHERVDPTTVPSLRQNRWMSPQELTTLLPDHTYHETQTSEVSQHTGDHSWYPRDRFKEQTP